MSEPQQSSVPVPVIDFTALSDTRAGWESALLMVRALNNPSRAHVVIMKMTLDAKRCRSLAIHFTLQVDKMGQTFSLAS